MPEDAKWVAANRNIVCVGIDRAEDEVFLIPNGVYDLFKSRGLVRDAEDPNAEPELAEEPEEPEAEAAEAAEAPEEDEAPADEEPEPDADEAPADEAPEAEAEAEAEPEPEEEPDEAPADEEPEPEEEPEPDEEEEPEWNLSMDPAEYLNRGYEKHAEKARAVLRARGEEVPE